MRDQFIYNFIINNKAILIDEFLIDAKEIDVDAISDGSEIFIAGILEHIEQAGVHSGDSACILPPQTLSNKLIKKIKDITKSISRSLKNISAQIIDDANSKTILSASSNEKGMKSGKINKTELSKIVAEKLAKKAVEKKIKKIYFDRGQFKYHGRVKIFAETLRKNGMEF